MIGGNPVANPLAYPYELFGPGTELSDLHLAVRVNGDVALLKGIMKAVLEENDRRPGEVLDRLFIERHTHGFDAFAARFAQLRWSGL